MDLQGILIDIDFEKAFESWNWNFLIAVLEKLNVGTSLIKWIGVFFTNVSSCIINNGFTSKYFRVKRGVRQGDPLSLYLFTMAEVMACKIRQEDNIKGVHIEDETVKVLQYADDTNGILQDKGFAKQFLDTVQEYGLYSGLRLNTTKTEGMWLWKYRHNTSKPLNILWPDRPLRILRLKYIEYQVAKDNHRTDQWVEKWCIL